MAAMTGLALVGAVPMTAEEHERARLMPFVHQLLSCELVRRVLDHWTPPAPPVTADAATSVTEEELSAAAAGGRSGPPPDLVTCHQTGPLVTDFRGAADREPTPRQLRLRLDRLQAVRRAARLEELPADLADRSPTPPTGPDWSPSPPAGPDGGCSRLALHRQDAVDEEDDEDSEDPEQEGSRAGGRSQRRSSVGRELGAVADRMDAQRSLGPQTQRNQKTTEESPTVSGRPRGIASTAVTACGLAALGFLVRQMSSSDD